jgi:hypothetical protein
MIVASFGKYNLAQNPMASLKKSKELSVEEERKESSNPDSLPISGLLI